MPSKIKKSARFHNGELYFAAFCSIFLLGILTFTKKYGIILKRASPARRITRDLTIKCKMIYCTAGLSLSSITSPVAYERLDASACGYAKHKFQKNTQAYFGDRRMLRIGFVFDEPLRTPTYSIKFHTQAYRSGHNEAVLKTVRGNSHGGSNPSACAKKHQLFGWCFSIFCIKFVCGHNG